MGLRTRFNPGLPASSAAQGPLPIHCVENGFRNRNSPEFATFFYISPLYGIRQRRSRIFSRPNKDLADYLNLKTKIHND
jgi:hypothetical protein